MKDESSDWCLVSRDIATKREVVMDTFESYSLALARRDALADLGKANGAAMEWAIGPHARVLSVNWLPHGGKWEEYEVRPTSTAEGLISFVRGYGVRW